MLKGIILAGGSGRGASVDQRGSKQLMPILQQPMVYPLSTLMRSASARSSAHDAARAGRFRRLSVTAPRSGCGFSKPRSPPDGLAQAFIIGR